MMKALLLDFGGVLCFSSFELHPVIERVLGLEKGTLTWKGPFNPESDPLWQSIERDEITAREYFEIRAREVGELVGETWDVVTYNKFIRCSSPEDIIRPEAIETVRLSQARGIKVGLISNELELFFGKECVDRMPLIHEFDAIIDGTHTKILKPDPEAYRLALEALGAAAQETLFVDDQERNIIGAQKVGLQTLLFDMTQATDCFERVQARLGLHNN
jgi:putative hydrolase of the HAD superfamily